MVKEFENNMYRHVGVTNDTNERIITVFNSLDNDPYHAVVIYRDSLGNLDKEAIETLVFSSTGQNAITFADAMASHSQNLLSMFHEKGFLHRIHISNVTMTPANNIKVPLLEVVNSIRARTRLPALSMVDTKATVGQPHTDKEEKPLTIEERMETARGLLYEAMLLDKSAEDKRQAAKDLAPELFVKVPSDNNVSNIEDEKKKVVKQTVSVKTNVVTQTKRRGRPKKAV